MVKYGILWLVFSIQILAQPFYPEPEYKMTSSLFFNDAVAEVYNGRYISNSKTIELAIAHQNKEWDYDWFLLATVIPSSYGHFGFGYSNYGMNALPIVKQDNIGSYLSGTSTDTFEAIHLSYAPNLSWANVTTTVKLIERRLIDQVANAIKVDIRITSPLVFNQQLGIRSHYFLGTDYTWTDGSTEELPKYFSLFFIQPFQIARILFEYNHCTNYDELSSIFTQLGMQLGDDVEIIAAYQTSKTSTQLTYGSELKVTPIFKTRYLLTNDFNAYFNETMHNIAIGVTF